MGYPAAGVEGMYRNKREDAKRFLEHRHGKNYWIFNLCPLRENSYDKSFFDGHVSRYPFPDHYAPPLAVMPLLAREMKVWHSGSPERVSVVHCKAGKGRSGTMACTYLLSLSEDPTPPRLASQHLSAKEWAELRAKDILQIVPDDNEFTQEPEGVISSVLGEEGKNYDSPLEMSRANTVKSMDSTRSYPETLKTILDHHSSQRMKPTGKAAQTETPAKQRRGVSIASQRRFLSYWSLVLGGQQPPTFWSPVSSITKPPKARILEIKVRLREGGNFKFGVVNTVNAVMDKAAKWRAGEEGYEDRRAMTDDLVDILEKWERHTRKGDGALMGTRKEHSTEMDGEELSQLFEGEKKWDEEKMVRCFARMGVEKGKEPVKGKDDNGKATWTYPLHQLNADRWKFVKNQLEDEEDDEHTVSDDIQAAGLPASEQNSIVDVTRDVPIPGKGVVVNAHREVRVKLYYGRVFIGWCWFIPVFHLQDAQKGPTKLVFSQNELDFSFGIGKDILDVEVTMEWAAREATVADPATLSPELDDGRGTAAATAAQAMIYGEGIEGVKDVVHTEDAPKS
ncbi:phosphatases II [Flagelloscypha sp. PMI_526]|nr:phosphatases II [Flagelloscypha sp. PMI_526]